MNDKQGTAHASGTRTAKRTLMRFMACAFCLVLALSGLMARAPSAAALASSTNSTASSHWSMVFRVHSISLSCRFVAGRLNASRVTLTVK